MTEGCHECRAKVQTFYLGEENESSRQQFKVVEYSIKKGKEKIKVEV